MRYLQGGLFLTKWHGYLVGLIDDYVIQLIVFHQ